MANFTAANAGLDAYELSLTRPPLCPELRLWLLAPSEDLDRDHRSFPEGATPYWAFCWASGQAMARHLIDHPDIVRGRRVLDVGSGSGIVAIAAALAGASGVGACDEDPLALAACVRNARCNGIQLELFAALDEALEDDEWDVVLAADVCYEAGLRDALMPQERVGRRILVADPGRSPQPFDATPPLARYPARTVPELDEGTTGAAIFELKA